MDIEAGIRYLIAMNSTIARHGEAESKQSQHGMMAEHRKGRDVEDGEGRLREHATQHRAECKMHVKQRT